MSEITISGLTRRFGGVTAVDDIDLDVREGEFCALLGPSGCGKTTTLRCIAGLEQPDAGRIAIGGTLMADGAQGFSVPPNRRDLGMVFQSYALWPHLSLFGNVAYPLRVRRRPRAEIAERVEAALRLVGLEGLQNRATSELSGGQQQRVALARALASRPRVLLLDEPLSNLDAALRAHMRRELRRIHREIRTTSVYVTHDQLEAATLSDRVVVMHAGRIEQIGAPREIFGAPATRRVAEFVGYDNFVPARVAEIAGDTLVARPDGWPGVLRCRRRAAGIAPVGAPIVLAFRAGALAPAGAALAAVGVGPGARASGEPGASEAITASVLDAMYVGDLTEYVLDVHGTRLVARLPEGGDAGGLAPGGTVDLAIAPDQIVVLAP